MKFSILVALIAGAGLPTAEVTAQGQDQYAWGVAAGGIVPSRLAKDNHTAGPIGMVMVGIGGVSSPVGVRFDGIYGRLGDRDSNTTAIEQGSARVLGLMANVMFNVYGSDNRIFAVGGVGGFHYDPAADGTDAVQDFGVNAGLGLWIPRIHGFVEARWFNLYNALPDRATGASGRRSARIYPITFGIMF